MATAIKMPQLGMTMTEAKLIRWLKREGDSVSRGEPVAEIETDKLNAEVNANADGVLRRRLAAEGDTIKVLGILGVLGTADEPAEVIDAAAGSRAPAQKTVSATVAVGATHASPAPLPLGEAARRAGAGSGGTSSASRRHPSPLPEGEGIKASPIAKRLASDLGVDLAGVQGSGPNGRVVEADVRAAAQLGQGAQTPAPTIGYVRASPLAKRLARERGLDLHTIRGTGPDGRIVERDVLAAAESQLHAFGAAVGAPSDFPAGTTYPDYPEGLTARETIAMAGMRRVIAERMWASLQQMAQLTLTTEADATALVDLRTHLVPAARVYGHRAPTYTDLIVHIVARVLKQHPLLNSSLVGTPEAGQQHVAVWNEINVGVAVALERGLVVPVIRNADQKPLQAISQELGDLAERARGNRLSPDELQGGTFTVSNLGLQEIDGFTPVINPPQAAILGVGRIAKKPAVFEDQLAIRQMVTLSLTFDHRVVDGVPAGNFLRDVKRAIEAGTLEP